MNSNESTIAVQRIEAAIRQRYSPLPSLTMSTLAEQLNQFRTGELRPASRTWEIMVERDGELAANIAKRGADVARLEWDIQCSEESPKAEAHSEALRYLYNNIRTRSALDQDEVGGIRTLIRQMISAHAHRYSVHELILRVDDPSAREVTFEARHCPVWFFESKRGRLGFLRSEASLYGDEMKPGEWLVTVGHGFMRQCSVAYLGKWLAAGSWMLFCQRFGLPGIQGKTTAAVDSPEWHAFEDALAQFASNWIAVTNKDADINLIETKGGGSSSLPFPGMIEVADRLYAKLFRGSDLATQSAGNGAVGASLQTDEKDALLADDAELINETLNQGIDRPLIEYLFGEEPLAYFRLCPPRRLNVDSDIKAAEFLTGQGCKIAKSAAMERLGWVEAEEGEETLGDNAPEPAASAPAGTAPKLQPNLEDEAAATQAAVENEGALQVKGTAQFAQAIAADLAPFRRRLAAIGAITDPDVQRARLTALLAEWDNLQADILADPESAQAMARIQGAAAISGLTTGKAPGSP